MTDETGAAAAVAPETPPAETPPQDTEPPEQETASPEPEKDTRTPLQRARDLGKRFRSQARDTRGRFAREEKETEEPGETPAEPPADPEVPAREDASPPSAEVAEGYVRIDLPDGHALREQGQEFIDVPAAQEKSARALVNSWTRRSDVDKAWGAHKQASEEAARLRRQVARLEAEAQLRSSGELDQFVDPKLQEALANAEKNDPEMAKLLRESIAARQRELVAAKGYEAEQGIRDQEDAQAFLGQMFQQAPQQYGVWFENGGEPAFRAAVHQMIGAYGQFVDQRMAQGGEGPNVEEFFRGWVDPVYARDPKVVERVQQWRDRQAEDLRKQGHAAGRKEAETEQERQRREAAERHGRRPPTAPAGAARRGRATEAEPELPADANESQRERSFRQRAREIGRRFASR